MSHVPASKLTSAQAIATPPSSLYIVGICSQHLLCTSQNPSSWYCTDKIGHPAICLSMVVQPESKNRIASRRVIIFPQIPAQLLLLTRLKSSLLFRYCWCNRQYIRH